MPAGATTVAVLKAAVRTVLETIDDLGMVYTYEKGAPETPCVMMGLARARRATDDEENLLSELGRDGFAWTVPLRVYVVHDDPLTDQAQAESLMAQVVGAFDADYTLGNLAGVNDARVVDSEGSYLATEGDSPNFIEYVCSLEVLQLIS